MGQEEEERFKSKKEEAFHSLDPGPVGGGEPGPQAPHSPALPSAQDPAHARCFDHRITEIKRLRLRDLRAKGESMIRLVCFTKT